MKKNDLHGATKRKINELVDRVAKKAEGGTGDIEDFLESIGRGAEDAGRSAEKGLKSFDKRPRARGRLVRRDFAEEIRTYIADGIYDLMEEGHSEEEALRITMEKFDEAESKDDFADFFADFSMDFDGYDFGKRITLWHIQNGVTLGLFYATSIVFGLTLGAFIGYYTAGDIVSVCIGAAFGLFFGVSLGLFCHAILTLVRSLYK